MKDIDRYTDFFFFNNIFQNIRRLIIQIYFFFITNIDITLISRINTRKINKKFFFMIHIYIFIDNQAATASGFNNFTD